MERLFYYQVWSNTQILFKKRKMASEDKYSRSAATTKLI